MSRIIKIVVPLGLGGALAICIVSNYIKARTTASKHSCQTNLEMIDKEKARWALENKKPGSYVLSAEELFGPTKHIKDSPCCPIWSPSSGDSYILGRIDQKPRCSCPPHRVFLACAEVVDDSGAPIPGVRVDGKLTGNTDSRGWCELSGQYDVDLTGVQFTFSKAGYRTETVPIPEMWPLRVTLKR